ncbi:hypothetical protein F5B19DRAFT_488621 [Rostrohypoxylon terebratum]|nr:hypothetical protein F5B19DRAFT_488621 [Rostrohypoxylon terebratum]
MAKLEESHLIRIRNNQRRSRARHKEYVASLEERVRHSELRRMEANFEIQQAARRVVEENRKIRNLLYALGFDDEKITFFLQTGNIDANDATGPISARDQVSMSRLLDLLQQNETSMSEYELPTNNTSSPSGLRNIQRDGVGCNISNTPKSSQCQTSIHATAVNEHIQFPIPVMMTDDALTYDDQDFIQNSQPNLALGYPIVRHSQQPASLARPSDRSQLLEPVHYGYDIHLQNPTSCGLSTTKKQDEPRVGLYSILPPIVGNDCSPAPSEGTCQNSQCQPYTQASCFPNGKYMNGIVGVADNVSFPISPEMTEYLT